MKNILIYCFVWVQILMLVLSTFKSDQIRYVPISKAYYYHIAMTLALVIGYFLYYKFYFNNTIDSPKGKLIQYISKGYLYFSLAFVLVGFGTSMASVLAVTNLSNYFSAIFTGREDVLDLKIAIGSSGLPGYIKMFNYAPLGVFLVNISILIFLQIDNIIAKRRLQIIVVVSLVFALLKVLFSLDRLTILAIMGVLLYLFLVIPKGIKLYLLGVLLVLFWMLYFVTAAKMNGTSLIDFMILYANLGMSNFELLIEHFNQWSYGLNSFLFPTYFIAKTFGISLSVSEAPVSLWAGPQYFWGYLYMDFGNFSFIVCFLLGVILSYYQSKINKKDIWAVSIFFLILFFILSTMVIPISRAVEFWLMILTAVISVYWIKRDNDVKNNL